MSPLLILVVGVVVVIGLIIVLRVNAFIALITAAILVSLLSPGEVSEKISRVAAAFGSTVSAIGIVIALAAVIGTCLMDSGAADRIVRAFLKVLGEKRSSWALMGSGFVLSVPVFFDTVFYLLVPLARSLYRRTQKNYMLYLMAICAGGCITHTLVPPTPGPLYIANQLGIDLGLMIIMGAAVALPTAIVALMVCRLINRFVEIPMRSVSGQAEPEPVPDEQLPPLGLSLLPVLLPVILISAHTIATALANAELVNQMTPQIVNAEIEANSEGAKKLAKKLVSAKIVAPGEDIEALAEQIKEANIKVNAEEAGQLAAKLVAAEVFADNPDAPHGARNCTKITAITGDPNLAMFLSAVIAMSLLVWKRKLPLKELAQTVDRSLMSGGVIILITAGGGAFGAMLREAGIRAAIEGLFTGSSMIFLAVFVVSSLLKFAQGSSTVAMMTTVAIFSTMGISTEMLGCHQVYLALAIGAGALVGSWMNDSGFWIVSRMGVLTETEALKSWTLLLAVLGITSFGFTLLFSRLWPMI